MAELPDLPYDYDALEPVIDEATMKLHHDKHHAGYTKKYNAAVEGTELADRPVDEVLADLATVPQDIRTAVRNNGGGFSNHAKFWEWMAPVGEGGEPSDELMDEFEKTFGGFEGFKKNFTNAALGRFGSGWAWLVLDSGALSVMSTANQDTPLSQGKTPLLGLDVWEHSYYKRYGPGRADYVENWWKVVNWAKVNELFDSAQ